MESRLFADKRNEQGMLRLHLEGTEVDMALSEMTKPTSETDQDRDSVSPIYLAFKRAFDIVAALLLLSIFFLPLLIVTICIRWESPGPAIYRREVLALQDWEEADGIHALKTFPAYKLRSMITNAEEFLRLHPHLLAAFQKDWKLTDDPRITRMGAFLRSTSIDEIPQLLNVLKGEMSLIGPRMITREELVRYGVHAPRLLRVKPGLTGLWQVSGRQELSYEERVQLDMTYAETRSLWVDFIILLKTVKCVLQRRGAY
jgi:lipopolysaccharide/colanic/teichoic acid biosynthesis glycosyltransferase